MKKTVLIMSRIGLMVISAAFCQGCQSDTDKGAADNLPEVLTMKVEQSSVTLSTILPGRTSAYLVSDVRPQVNGIILKRLFNEGADVKEGEPLYQIDPATFQAAYDNAKAALAKAEATLDPARQRARRSAALVKANAISQQENEDTQSAVRQRIAEVAAAKAMLESARINLDYTRISAPISGRIGKSSITPGALVTAGQAEPLARVQQTDPIYVDFTQSANNLMRLKKAMTEGKLLKAGSECAPLKLLFDDGTSYSLPGKLLFADISVDPSSGMVSLRAEFPNPHNELLPGLFVRGVLVEAISEQAINIPQSVVSHDAKGNATVSIVNSNNEVESRIIVIDRANGSNWLISGGLEPGDKVIVKAQQKVRPGMKVRMSATESPAGAPSQDGQ